ncbi:MAG TPA: hypothetical protein VGX92_13285 [Pyrinomonadaceae bacterium]|nr:hypothetical protein [Pyrinomonadaceae bacterium]
MRLQKWAAFMLQVAESGGPQSSELIGMVLSAQEQAAKSPSESAEGSSEQDGPGGPSPPEHWVGLATTGPPAHWLELVQQSAPELLDEADGGFVSSADDGFASMHAMQTPTPEPPRLKAESPPAPERGHALRKRKPMPLLSSRRTVKRPAESAPASKPSIRPAPLRVEPSKPSMSRVKGTADGSTAEASQGEIEYARTAPSGVVDTETHETGLGQRAPLRAPELLSRQDDSENGSLMTTQSESSARPASHARRESDNGRKARRADAVYQRTARTRPASPSNARRRVDDTVDSTAASPAGATISVQATVQEAGPHVENRDMARREDIDRRETFAARNGNRAERSAHAARVETMHRPQSDFAAGDDLNAEAQRPAPDEVVVEVKEAARANASRANSSRATHAPRPRSDRELFKRAGERDFSRPRPTRAPLHHTTATETPALIHEQTLNEAASMHPSARALGPSNENPWPDLPAALPSEIMDEVAAFEDELKRGQRLEREQRGMSWNA